MTVMEIMRPARSIASRRFVDNRGGELALIEIVDGDAEILGPTISHADAEAMARTLLNACAARAPIPTAVHALALAYLDLLGRREVSS